MKIHTVNEHPDMKAKKKKLNARYHLHVQHLTNARTLKQEALGLNCIKDTRSNKGIRILKKMQNIN